jgi:hypothetical protein
MTSCSSGPRVSRYSTSTAPRSAIPCSASATSRPTSRRRADAARAAFLEACEALLFEAAALLRWSSLPFRDLEPGWPDAVRRRVEQAWARLAVYERRSASSVITAS